MLPAELLAQLEQLFLDTIALVYDVLGEKAFWLWRRRNTGWSWFSRPTTVLYDPVMFAFSQHLNRAGDLRTRREQIQASLHGFYEEHYSQFEGRYTNLSNIAERNRLFDDLLQEHLRAI